MRIDSSYVSEYESFGWHNTSYIQTVDMTVFFLYSENAPNRKFSRLYVCYDGKFTLIYQSVRFVSDS